MRTDSARVLMESLFQPLGPSSVRTRHISKAMRHRSAPQGPSNMPFSHPHPLTRYIFEPSQGEACIAAVLAGGQNRLFKRRSCRGRNVNETNCWSVPFSAACSDCSDYATVLLNPGLGTNYVALDESGMCGCMQSYYAF